MLPESECGRKAQQYIEDTPFYKDSYVRKRKEENRSDLSIYLPHYHSYMKSIYTWLCIEIDKDDELLDDGYDITEYISAEMDTNSDTAYCINLRYVNGDDMNITIYIPNTGVNYYEIHHFIDYLAELGDDTMYYTVNNTFAELHPDNHNDSGHYDVEECMYLKQIQTPRLLPGQHYYEWLRECPKHTDWKKFLTKDLP